MLVHHRSPLDRRLPLLRSAVLFSGYNRKEIGNDPGIVRSQAPRRPTLRCHCLAGVRKAGRARMVLRRNDSPLPMPTSVCTADAGIYRTPTLACPLSRIGGSSAVA